MGDRVLILKLLVKSFRYYLMETVKNFFPKKLKRTEWKINNVCNGTYGAHKNNESLSFIKIENNKIINIEEKIKISDNYCCGIYGFINIDIFKQYCKKLINNNEYYFSQIYKLMIKDQIDITPVQIQYTKLFDTENKLVVKPLRICFDLDNTLVTNPSVPDDYSTVNPIQKNILLLQQLKKMGHEIIIYTARRMKTHKNNIGKVLNRSKTFFQSTTFLLIGY